MYVPCAASIVLLRFHSRVVNPATGAKCGEHDDELIVFNNDAIVAKYLMVFDPSANAPGPDPPGCVVM